MDKEDKPKGRGNPNVGQEMKLRQQIRALEADKAALEAELEKVKSLEQGRKDLMDELENEKEELRERLASGCLVNMSEREREIAAHLVHYSSRKTVQELLIFGLQELYANNHGDYVWGKIKKK
jgi:flagellar biosynthesis GTPase FlhF